MTWLKRLLWLDFVLSLTAAWTFAMPSESAAQYGLCLDGPADPLCSLAYLQMQLFYGKSLAHSAGILAAAMSNERRTVLIVAAGVCAWCFTMPTLLTLYGFGRALLPICATMVGFGTLYAVLIARTLLERGATPPSIGPADSAAAPATPR